VSKEDIQLDMTD
jgi:hypothetical protein